MQNIFGAGVLWGTPTADAFGNAIANPTPVQLGVCQEIGLDLSAENKLLYGNQQMPIAIGRGKMKIGLKFKFAQVNAATLNTLFFGQTVTSGILGDVWDRSGTVAAATVTVTPPSGGTWTKDLGVVTASGAPMTRVASAPTTGQYSVAAGGAYTFNAADVTAALVVYISYQYTATSTVAKTSGLLSLAMGNAPSFRTDILMPFQGKQVVWTLNNCVSSKLSFQTKLDDFTIPEMDADVFADAVGNIGSYGVSE